jgi:hypothetical protein
MQCNPTPPTMSPTIAILVALCVAVPGYLYDEVASLPLESLQSPNVP